MKKEVFETIFVYALLITAGLIIGTAIAERNKQPSAATEEAREVFVDTIPYYMPVPKDSVVIRYETATLPRIDTGVSATMTTDTLITDSVSVLVPISSVSYQDSTYSVYISGYRAQLDSIFVFPRREVITIRHKPKRWSIGVSAGYAFTPKGFQPYIGVGISWKFAEF